MWNASPASLADPLQLGRKDALDLRSALLRVLTDLYLQQPVHTPEDESYYTELALRLLDAVDVSERAALAARLARYSSAPRALLDRLARDVIQVARPILDHPRWIGPAGGKSAAQAPTSPAGPPPTGTSHSPTESEAYALWQLFFAASSVERRLILVNLDYAVLIPMASLSSAACAEIWRWASVIPQPRIEAAAHELETALGVSRMQLRRILDDERGEPMVVVAKAINLPAKLLVRWLEQRDCAMTRPADHIEVLAALYDEISVASARRMVTIWQAADAKPETRRKPYGSSHDAIEEVAAGTILHLDDPRVRIEF